LIKYILLLVFFAVMLGVGFYCRKTATDVNGFVLGGRSVGPWVTAFAYGTSYFSEVIFVGYAGQFGWKFGLASTWIGLGNAFLGSLLAWAVLGRRTRVMTQHLKSATMPDFFEKRFDSKALKIVAAVITFIFLVPYTASLYNGLSRLFGLAFNIDYSVCVIVMAVLTCIYVVVGGYMATAINDFIQGLIMLFGIVAVVVAVLNGNGGFYEAINSLSQVSEEGIKMQGAFTSFFGPDALGLLFVVLLTSLGTWGLPQMVGKFYAIKDEKAVKTGTIVSTVFALVVAGGCYFLGGFGRLYTPDYSPEGKIIYDSIIPKMVEGLPEILIGIVIVLVLSASMSTLSSLVLTSGSTLTLDFIEPLKKKSLTEKQKLLSIRILIAFFVIISAAIAIVQAKSSVTFIAQLMGVSWGALAGAFLAPFLYGLYLKRTTKAAVWVSFISGCGIMILNLLCPSVFPVFFKSPINAGVLAMVVGLVLVPIVSYITPKPKNNVDEIFTCYDRKITVRASRALGDDE